MGTADTAAGPETAAEISQRDAAIRAALHSLDAQQRQIIVLRDYLDLTYAEIGSLRKAIGDTSLSDVSKDVWRENMNDSTVKASRGIGWLLFIGGLLIAAGFAIFEFIEEWNSIPIIARLIIVGVYGGLLLLFFSVLRQRLIERKTDRYKDVEI